MSKEYNDRWTKPLREAYREQPKVALGIAIQAQRMAPRRGIDEATQ